MHCPGLNFAGDQRPDCNLVGRREKRGFSLQPAALNECMEEKRTLAGPLALSLRPPAGFSIHISYSVMRLDRGRRVVVVAVRRREREAGVQACQRSRVRRFSRLTASSLE